MAGELDYLVFGSNNHTYETKDAFKRHLSKKYREAIKYVEIDGRSATKAKEWAGAGPREPFDGRAQ